MKNKKGTGHIISIETLCKLSTNPLIDSQLERYRRFINLNNKCSEMNPTSNILKELFEITFTYPLLTKNVPKKLAFKIKLFNFS